jgi:DNA-binding transcriptional ArsR family regulator
MQRTDLPGRPLKLDPRRRRRLRDRSKKLFGNADRLEVAYAIAASSGLVHAQELSDRLGITPPRVRTQLLAHVGAGLMTALPVVEQVKNYQRLEDPYWRHIQDLVDAWSRDDD